MLLDRKKSKAIFIFVLALTFSLSILGYCYFHNSKSKFFRGTELRGAALGLSDSLGLPTSIIFNSEKLFILDSSPVNDDNHIRVFDPNTSKFITSFGKSGSGPGEYEGLWSISQKITNKNILILYDLIGLRITALNINSINNIFIDTILTFKEGTPLSPAWLNDSTIISNGGSLKRGRYAEYCIDGSLKKYVGQILPGKKPETPTPIHSEASIGKLKVTPDGKHIVLVSLNSDYLDIFDDTGNLVKRVEGPKGLDPQYKIKSINGEPKLSYADVHIILCYIDVTVTNNRIFALYSGEELQGATGGSIIHVFDIDGTFVKTYTVKEKLGGICIDSHRNLLYGIQNEPLPDIVVYEL